MTTTVKMHRVYEARTRGDGCRILVDSLWPRGLSKSRADLDEWCKDVAPSAQLRTWYDHDPKRFNEFRRRYRAELTSGDRANAFQHLRELAATCNLTLLTATKHIELSQAAVLADLLGR